MLYDALINIYLKLIVKCLPLYKKKLAINE